MKTTLTILIFVLIQFKAVYPTQPYKEWRQGISWKSKDAYHLLKSTVVCRTHKGAVDAYNHIVSNNGNFFPKKIRRNFPCSALQGYTFGRIVERKEGSTIVLVEFQWPMDKLVTKKYIYIEALIPMTEFKKRIVK